jgi:hypothetical protein
MHQRARSTAVLGAVLLVAAKPVSLDFELPAGPLREVSGCAFSAKEPNVVWLHNDSGDSARVFRLDVKTRTVKAVRVRGAEADDWEDIAVAPNRDLVIGDIGDNASARANVTLYRVPDPGRAAATSEALAETLAYDDGAHDAEALVIDPGSGATYVVTKTDDGTSGVYRADGAVLKRVGKVVLAEGGFLFPNRITGADALPDGSGVVLRTYQSGYVLRRAKGRDWESAWSSTPEPFELPAMIQGESICVRRDGRSVMTTTESRGAAKIPFAFTPVPIAAKGTS